MNKPYFVSSFPVALTEEQHGFIARYAVQNGMSMESAVLSMFYDGFYNAMRPEVMANSQRNAERAGVPA